MPCMVNNQLISFLNKKVKEYNTPGFIKNDPISVPHKFSKKQDIEIAAFFAAIFAWGNRTTIINKANELMALMDNSPHEFCIGHADKDLKGLLGFKHRTFNDTDLLYFVEFFKQHYATHSSLEAAFTNNEKYTAENVEVALNNFYKNFFSLHAVPRRTYKHISAPFKKSACKRINMFLRWMVRDDKAGVDFGLWKNIKPGQLVMPLDLHVARVAKQFKLVARNGNDWKTAVELTNTMKFLDKNDPCKYDFALFALGVLEKF